VFFMLVFVFCVTSLTRKRGRNGLSTRLAFSPEFGPAELPAIDFHGTEFESRGKSGLKYFALLVEVNGLTVRRKNEVLRVISPCQEETQLESGRTPRRARVTKKKNYRKTNGWLSRRNLSKNKVRDLRRC